MLLYVLWAVLLLAIFAASVSSQALFALGLSERLSDQLQAAYLARSAVEYALVELERDPTPKVDGLADPWANHPSVFQEHRVGSGVFSVVSKPADGSERYGLTDEEQRINLNTAPADVLQRLFELSGLREREATEIAAAILDWRDVDTDEQPDGAERFYYRSLTHAYDCKDSPFENVEELLLIRGMTPELYHRVEPYVTAYGSGYVNLNTAGTMVLRALGLSEIGLAGFREYRSGEDGIEGTSDSRELISVSALGSELSSYLPANDLALLSRLAQKNLLGVKSEAFRMSIEAQLEHPNSRVRLFCVMDRQGTPLLWSER